MTVKSVESVDSSTQGISQPDSLYLGFMSISAKKKLILCVDYNSGLRSAENHGNVLELLPIDSHRSGDMIFKKSHRKICFHHGEK